jgi:hypothetical protein
MAHIFISYSRRDREYARKLVDSLLERGFDVWFDEHIEYGVNWETAIFRAIDACAAFVVLMSPDSMNSDWVQRECAYADRRRKPAFPVLLAGEEFPRFMLIQFADGREGKLPGEVFYTKLAELTPPAAGARGVELAQKDVERLPPPIEDTRTRRLETAMPRQSQRGQRTEVRVKVSLPDSPGLRGELPDITEFGDEIRKEDVRDTGFPLSFPTDSSGRPLPVALCVQVISDHYTAHYPPNACGDGGAELEVPPVHDSRTVIFALTPTDSAFVGRASLTVRILRQGKVIAENVISTRVVEQVAEAAYGLATAALTWAMAGPAPAAPLGAVEVTRRVARAIPPEPASAPASVSPRPQPVPGRMMPAPARPRRSGAPLGGLVAVAFAALLGLSVLLVSQGRQPLLGTTALATDGPSRTQSATSLSTSTAPPSAVLVFGVVDSVGDTAKIFERTPAAGFTEIGTLDKGTEVEVISKSVGAEQTWLWVAKDDGERVWMHAEEVRLPEGITLNDIPEWQPPR